MTGQVAERSHLTESIAQQQVGDRFRLVITVFEQQPAAVVQVRRRIARDDADVVQAVAAGGQCADRLMAQVALPQVRIAVGDVGRVAGDQVEALARQRRQPMTVAEIHTRQPERLGIATRHRERGLAGVGGDDPRTGALVGERQRDRTGAGAQVGDVQGMAFGQAFQRQFDELVEEFDELVEEPKSIRGEPIERRVGFWIVDSLAQEPRGGMYFRTFSRPAGFVDTLSYGFVHQPNDQGSPFGAAGYEVDSLGRDWYTFVASNDF